MISNPLVRSRVDFYVRQGLVEHPPSDQQIEEASKGNKAAAGVWERIRYYARRPLEIFPTAKKRARFQRTNEEISKLGTDTSNDSPGNRESIDSLAALDRALVKLFLFSPARFAAQCLFNPYTVVPSTGMDIPTRFLISHVLHSPHPTALWDLQIIAGDEGGLDEFERQLNLCKESSGLRWRIYRALAQRPGYYSYLTDLLARVKRFDYPEPPPGFNPVYENVVDFLNHAARL